MKIPHSMWDFHGVPRLHAASGIANQRDLEFHRRVNVK
jgi:hypothetical protein